MAVFHLINEDGKVAVCGRPVPPDVDPAPTDNVCPVCLLTTVKHLTKISRILLEVNEKTVLAIERLSKH